MQSAAFHFLSAREIVALSHVSARMRNLVRIQLPVQSAVFHFLSMREIVALSHVSARMRNLARARLPVVVSTRFPGRCSVGLDDDQSLALPPWKFALLLEARGHRAARICYSDVRADLLLRGDILDDDDDDTWYYWTGTRAIPSRYPSAPLPFEVPREFPPDYIEPRYQINYKLNIARYREELLRTLTDGADYGCIATFTEHRRVYGCEIPLHDMDWSRKLIERCDYAFSEYSADKNVFTVLTFLVDKKTN